MKLKNKKTGEIVELFGISRKGDRTFVQFEDDKGVFKGEYSSLAELNAEWEDYEEPKGNWTIDPINEDCIDDGRYTTPDELERYEELGLKFNTKEEAEKAVEKLKAWKRLKDSGFVFCGKGDCLDTIKFDYGPTGYNNQDFNLLFGGEE